MKKPVKYFLIALPVLALILLIALEVMSRGAAEIFNHAMQEQQMLKGTITTEKISANIWGEVSFKNLLWKDERGGTILEIPEGSFQVRLYDVLTKNFKTTTVQELHLRGASISLNLDENMKVDFIRQSPDFKEVNAEMKTNSDGWEEKVSSVSKTEEELKEIGERRRRMQRSKIETGWQNFNLEGRKVKLNLALEDCSFEIFYRERHYLLRGVDFLANVDTSDEMTLDVKTGGFGGTMIGRGMNMRGKIDFKTQPVPECDLQIVLREVDPSSLGMGLNIHDKMTLRAHFTGAVTQPLGRGLVKLDELHIPGIDFQNVSGKIRYEDATLNFVDVTADVYDGSLDAYGDYNIDTRYYNIYGHGKDLKAYTALPKSHLHCNVDLELAINSKGSPKNTTTSGSFVSGKGRYSVLFFEKLSGKFKNEYQNLSFYDVEIDMGGYKISTDALSIVDKKLTLAPIRITNAQGELVRTYIHD